MVRAADVRFGAKRYITSDPFWYENAFGRNGRSMFCPQKGVVFADKRVYSVPV
jgi:hypothetical protein